MVDQTLLEKLYEAIKKVLGRALSAAEKLKVQNDLGLSKKPIGYFIDPNQTPLDKISFTEAHQRGWKSVAIRVTNDGTKGIGTDKLDKVQKTLDSAKITESLAWVWCNENSQFSKTKEVAQSQFDGLIVDCETYVVNKVIPYLKQIVKDAGSKEVIMCMKPHLWDGDQKPKEILALDKRVLIAFMAYINDYNKNLTELKAFYKGMKEEYGDRFIAIIQTYKGDSNQVPKTNTQIQAEIDAVSPYVKGILLFRYGDNVSNFMVKDVPKTNTTNTWKGEPWLQFEKSCNTTFNNFTEIYTWILNNTDYSYYLDGKYNWQQEKDRKLNYLNCVDMDQALIKIAKSGGYEAVPYGIHCNVQNVGHAIFKIRGKEFKNWTWIDGAAAASENYPLGSYWCVGGALTERPSWIPEE